MAARTPPASPAVVLQGSRIPRHPAHRWSFDQPGKEGRITADTDGRTDASCCCSAGSLRCEKPNAWVRGWPALARRGRQGRPASRRPESKTRVRVTRAGSLPSAIALPLRTAIALPSALTLPSAIPLPLWALPLRTATALHCAALLCATQQQPLRTLGAWGTGRGGGEG
jgi:hypothetical protein